MRIKVQRNAITVQVCILGEIRWWMKNVIEKVN
jgi:hypothetical protein